MPPAPTKAPRVLFEDNHLLVLSKPAGLLSQGDISGEPHLVEWAQTHVGRPYVGLIHRLDRNTSGLMVLGKRTKASERLTRALQEGRLERRYLAVLEGELRGRHEWVNWLVKNGDKNEVSIAKADAAGAKEARLVVEAKDSRATARGTLTLAEFCLETGRSHQIRVQAAERGHPLAGDRKYGSRVDFPRPALHSAYLKFPHPMGGEILEFRDELPDDIRRLLPLPEVG